MANRIHLIVNAEGLEKVVVSEVFALYTFLAALSFFWSTSLSLLILRIPFPLRSVVSLPMA